MGAAGIFKEILNKVLTIPSFTQQLLAKEIQRDNFIQI